MDYRIITVFVIALIAIPQNGVGNVPVNDNNLGNFQEYDWDHNKIEDSIEGFFGSGEFLVRTNGPIDWYAYGYKLKYQTGDRSISWIKGKGNNLRILAQNENVVFIEGVKKIEPHLFYSSKQIGVNPGIWDLGYTGSQEMSVAVLDTGIDATHPAFQNKQITWVDLAGVSLSVDGDEYANPVDKGGHGTHVAGIIAGSPTSNLEEGFVGQVPPVSSFQIVKSVSDHQNNIVLNFTIDWGNAGDDNPGNHLTVIATPSNNVGNVVAFLDTDTSGLFQGTLTLSPGEYLIGVANQETNGPNPEGLPYSIKTTIIKDSNEPETGYKNWRGIAPDVNLVAIKVFDDSGNGNTGSLLQGLDWIKNNYDTYNITVVNMSLGTDSISSVIDSEVENLANLGILVVASAGNEGVNANGIGSPGSAPFALTVGAVNRMNEIAYYSSNGDPNVNTVTKPDILAPGGSAAIPGLGDVSGYTAGNGLILSAMPFGQTPFGNALITGKQGTSMAAPHVSGVAAILYQILNEKGELTHSINDVKRVKQVLELSAFEVGNILNGGEKIQGGTQQNPPIDPETKDFVEGWGAINPLAAVSLVLETASPNSPKADELSLENSFIQNSVARKITLSGGISYTFWSTIPQGASVDFILYDGNPDQYGDPVPLVHRNIDASLQEGILNLPVLINQSGEYYYSLKLRDSVNAIDRIHHVVLEDNFVPFINPLSPVPDGYVNQTNLEIRFESMTNQVDASIDGNNIGVISDGYVISGLSQGEHSLSLEERNENTGTKANTTFTFTVDLTLPQLVSNLTSITTDQALLIEYNATDNMGIDFVRARIGNSILAQSNESSGTLTVNPQHLPPGTYDLVVEVFDHAGNVARESAQVTFVHDIFIEGEDLMEVEFADAITLRWNAGSQKPSQFKIFIDDVLVHEENWNGGDIVYSFSPVSLGEYNITVMVINTDGDTATATTIVQVQDTTPPVIHILGDMILDATEPQELNLSIIEPFPHSIQIRYKEQTILFLRPWNGSMFFQPLMITGEPNTFAQVDIGVVDTSGNIANKSELIQWKDLTPPSIQDLEDITITVGETRDLTWTWEEKFVEKVTMYKNAEIIFETTEFISSIEFTVGEASPGTVEYKIVIEDAGNNTAISTVNVAVIDIVTSEASGQAFLSFEIIWFAVPIILAGRKRLRL
ncbi:MAG: hypothetical protein D6732_08655 [Methanobacteriota archaeon]|nr:MAG: hypothetical protein D6732_08655 [Euryarchaeota archaeon]